MDRSPLHSDAWQQWQPFRIDLCCPQPRCGLVLGAGGRIQRGPRWLEVWGARRRPAIWAARSAHLRIRATARRRRLGRLARGGPAFRPRRATGALARRRQCRWRAHATRSLRPPRRPAPKVVHAGGRGARECHGRGLGHRSKCKRRQFCPLADLASGRGHRRRQGRPPKGAHGFWTSLQATSPSARRWTASWGWSTSGAAPLCGWATGS